MAAEKSEPSLPSVVVTPAWPVAAINAIKGQVMKLSKGQANIQIVSEILERKLAE